MIHRRIQVLWGTQRVKTYYQPAERPGVTNEPQTVDKPIHSRKEQLA